MIALSVRQPNAEDIASGAKPREYRTWARPGLIGKDLLIVASKVADDARGARLPCGVAICVVHVDAIDGEEGAYEWVFSNPRRVLPVEVKGSASLYHVSDALIAIDMAAQDEDAVYYCPCSWLGGDPDERTVRGTVKRTCPACWRHDRRRVEVSTNQPVPAEAPKSASRPKRGRASARPMAGSYTFQDEDRVLRGHTARTMPEASELARRLADEIGDYVFIMRDGINVGGEWHAAKRDAS